MTVSEKLIFEGPTLHLSSSNYFFASLVQLNSHTAIFVGCFALVAQTYIIGDVVAI